MPPPFTLSGTLAVDAVHLHRLRRHLHGQRRRRLRRHQLLPDHRHAAAVHRRGAHLHRCAPTASRSPPGPARPTSSTRPARSAPTSSPSAARPSSSAARTDVAAFDGQHYYAITNNQFTDTNTGLTYTLSGNTAVNQGNSYEIYSNLGAGRLLPGPRRPHVLRQRRRRRYRHRQRQHLQRLPDLRRPVHHPAATTPSPSPAARSPSPRSRSPAAPTVISTLTAAGGKLTGGYFTDPGHQHHLHLRRRRRRHHASSTRTTPSIRIPAPGTTNVLRRLGRRHHRASPWRSTTRRRRAGLSGPQQPVHCRHHRPTPSTCRSPTRTPRPAPTGPW